MPHGFKKRRFSVAVFLVQRCDGGPEEGGWTFDAGEVPAEFRKSIMWRSSRAKARRLADRLRRELLPQLNEDRRPIHSVLSDGVYEVHVNKGSPLPFPIERPRYE
jgi:hypothetical protein